MLTITSVIPKVRRRVRVISSSVRPESSTRALARVSVSGRRRVPRPAARIIAFITALSLAHFLQLDVADHNFQAVSVAQTFCQLFRQVDRAVLASGAAEGDHEILEAALLVSAHAGIHQ